MLGRLIVAGAALVACSDFGDRDSTTPAADAGGDGGSISPDGGDAAPGPPCPNAVCGAVLATDQTNADEIVVDDERVYWTINDDPGAVRARDLAAGELHVVTPTTRPRAPYLFSDMIHFATGSEVRHINRDANAGGSSLSAAQASGPVTSIARAGGRIFATASVFVHNCPEVGNTCADLSFAGQYRFDAGPNTRALTVDRTGTRVWLASDECVTKGDAASGSFTKWWPLTNVRAIVADDISVYLARDGVGGITKFGRDDGIDAKPTMIAAMGPPAYALAESGDSIFYTALEQGVVVKVAKNGSRTEVLASGLSYPRGIALRAGKVFIALGDGRIVTIPQ